MKQIIKSALAIDELAYDLENISTDDKKQIEDYTDLEIVKEAEYVLSTFYESGHINGDALAGEFDHTDDPHGRKWARGEVRKLKAFIKKYG